MIDIDTSFGEGGDQILRSDLTLSVLTSQAVRWSISGLGDQLLLPLCFAPGRSVLAVGSLYI